jgi:hypothetical protein
MVTNTIFYVCVERLSLHKRLNEKRCKKVEQKQAPHGGKGIEK